MLNSINFKKEMFATNFLNYIEKILLDSKNKDFNPQNSLLLVGSNMNIENRILSAKFLQNKSNKVISFNHSSYPFYIYKEPIRNVEYSLCTDYVSYGSFKFENFRS